MESSATAGEQTSNSSRTDLARASDGLYSIKPLLEDLPLSPKTDGTAAEITVVEAWSGNLYIGTSAGEILHFVQIVPDGNEADGSEEYILATRLEPYFAPNTIPDHKYTGIMQILLLPAADKACVICNGTLTFYTIPELSPALSKTRVKDCNWIGGLDLDKPSPSDGSDEGAIVLLSLRRVLRIVRIREQAQVLKTIEYPASVSVQRRSNIACVATQDGYALLDLDLSRRIPLPFSVSSEGEPDHSDDTMQAQQVPSSSAGPGRRMSALPPSSGGDKSSTAGHGRSTSLGTFMSGLARRDQSPRTSVPAPDTLEAHESPARGTSPNNRTEKPLPIPPPSEALEDPNPIGTPHKADLWPIVISPNSDEFLVTTGTGLTDPGVGIFINTEGDVTKGTLEFRRYPRALVSVRSDLKHPFTKAGSSQTACVIAALDGQPELSLSPALEIHRIDRTDDDDTFEPAILPVPMSRVIGQIGIRLTLDSFVHVDNQLSRLLEKRPWHIAHSIASTHPDDGPRQLEEAGIVRGLATTRTHLLTYSGASIWQVLPNLEVAQDAIGLISDPENVDLIQEMAQRAVYTAPIDPAAFLVSEYIRQQCGLLLLHNAIRARSLDLFNRSYHLLSETGLDPRCILSLFSATKDDVFWGSSWLWLCQGIQEELSRISQTMIGSTTVGRATGEETVKEQFLLPFLQIWRKRRNFASVQDCENIFKSVDLALLRILLLLDQRQSVPSRSSSLPGLPDQQPPQPSSRRIRTDLYALVDSGTSCFDEAASILENQKRLFVLSRLYQSRKRSGDVLRTWRRLIEGEEDSGGGDEFDTDQGLERVYDYLLRIRDRGLVREYGLWLAVREPSLGVHIFANDRGRVKFTHEEVVAMLRENAPDAVKYYLEFLVFEKDEPQYAGELLQYYLDSVIGTLETRAEARTQISETYKAYRDLTDPRPTYTQFITENAMPEEWWHHRLRLLQILGGGVTGRLSTSDNAPAIEPGVIVQIQHKIRKYDKLLIPEAIILDGLRGLHDKALHHLVHGLGDFDTAIQYCLHGGSAGFHPIAGRVGTAMPNRSAGRPQPVHLFSSLLNIVLEIPYPNIRRLQTVYLLNQHPKYFDPLPTLKKLPADWPIAETAPYLFGALRLLVKAQAENRVVKGLTGLQSLKYTGELLEKITEIGPRFELLKDSGVSFS